MEKEYYKLYRGSTISEKIISADMESLSEQGSGRFVVYNDFLSTTRDRKVAEGFLKMGDITGDLVRVFYSFLIPKSEADANPNLICFIEEISLYKNELEVLISSSTIFQIQKIEKKKIKEVKNKITYNIDYYEVTLIFISNGFNKFDFIKYSTLIFIGLESNQIGDEILSR